MRRKDREVTDINEIMKIVDRCDIVRIGLTDGDYPYIVPVNFSYTYENGRLSLYIHGAMAGRKYELITRNKKCSFEMDIVLGLEYLPEKHDVTERYLCVMGTADIVLIPEEEKKSVIDNIIMARYEGTRNFKYNESNIPHTMIARLEVNELTAKANKPKSGPD